MPDDLAVLNLIVLDSATMRCRLLHACVCFLYQAPEKEGTIFIAVSKMMGANFSFIRSALFSKKYLCTKMTLLMCSPCFPGFGVW